MDDDMRRAREALKRVFGYAEFRPGQERAISRILAGGDLLAVLPTGGGKSICYQIPALIGDGLTLVISPLISLMKDQVDQLVQLGVPAGALNSSIDAQQAGEWMRMARGGQLKLLYVAPERLDFELSRAELWNCDVRRVIIDEAHCVSQWGHDFRPSYLNIAQFISGFERRPAVAAFTATATDRVSRDIEELLELRSPELVKTGYDRPNLEFSVVRLKKSLRCDYIRRYIDGHAGQSGIVYCSSRRDAEELAGALGAECYHAGMDDAARRRAQEAFINDANYVICATNAFGMGIDKPDVRFVIHYHMPASIEAYWQEAGRAGRDGLASECVLLADSNDCNFWMHMISRDEGDESEKDKRRQRLRAMAQYVHESGCLRRRLVSYFGEEIGDCGVCSNCCAEGMYQDVTREAQMVLSAVKRCGERVGKAMIARVLKGSGDKRIVELGLDRQSTYGLMRNVERTRITELIDELIAQGYLELTAGQYPVLRLTGCSAGVLRGQEQVRMRLQTGDEYVRDVLSERSEVRPERRKGGRDRRVPYGDPLFERLRALRRRIADEQGVPAFIVFGDSTLIDMARRRPTTRGALLNVSGVGEQKLARYGDRFISEISAYLAEGGNAESTDVQMRDDDGATLNPDMMKYLEAAYREGDMPMASEAAAQYEPVQDAQGEGALPGSAGTSRQDGRELRAMAGDLSEFVRAHASEFMQEYPRYSARDVMALCEQLNRLGFEKRA